MLNFETPQILERAKAHHQAGRLPEALGMYRQILLAQPGHAEALHWLGVLAGQTGQLAGAVELIGRAIAADSSQGVYYSNLGKFLVDLGRLDEAVVASRRAVELMPVLGEGYNNLGNALQQSGRLDEALVCFQRALELNGDDAAAHFNLGNVLKAQGRLEEAVGCYQRAVALRGDVAKVHNNLGLVLAELGRIEQANLSFARAVEISPDYAEAHCNWGNALMDDGRFAEAQARYERAIALRPDYPAAHWNFCLLLLAWGHLQRGWQEMEWRCRELAAERGFVQPHWNGSPAPGKTVLLHAVGGHGDTLQFVRLAKDLRPRVGRIVLECQPALVPLLQGLPGVDQVVARGEPLPAFDLHAPLQSLPGMAGVTLENIPNTVPYVQPPIDRQQRWAGRVAKGEKLNVGLAWAGSSSAARYRSGSLAVFGPLARVPGVRFFSLQHGPAAADPRPAGLELIDFAGELVDFADTAAVVEQLDLVISVDTSVVHLAGALGREVWVLIPRLSDFRWLRDRTDSPWYPTMRLFRQTQVGEWANVLEEVARALEAKALDPRIPQKI